MSTLPEFLEINYDGVPINDLIVTINHAAEKAETHIAFQGSVPEYVTKSDGLREIAAELGKARDAAAGKDMDKVAHKNNMVARGKRALVINAHHITMLSLHRNDPSILLNAGYAPKQKSSGKTPTNLLNLVPGLFVKHGKNSGSVIVTVKRVKQTASIELQITDKDPSNESAYEGRGMYNKSRIELNGFVPATKVYFRVRYHEDGAAGRWSATVGLIIL